MAVIGITGGIGSGKSEFRNRLAAYLSADIFDADLVARELLESDPAVRERVQAEVSAKAYGPNGRADRELIRKLVFADREAKRRLEGILHPLVREAWIRMASNPIYLSRHFLVDIPLLFETDAQDHFHKIVTVACSPDVQRMRLASRGMPADIANAIIASQLPTSEKTARSHHVVWNDGSLDALDAQAKSLAGRLAVDPDHGIV